MLNKSIDRCARSLRVAARCAAAGRWAMAGLVSVAVLAPLAAAANSAVEGVAAAPAGQHAALSPAAAGHGSTATPDAAAASEPALRLAVMAALWPQDIARLAGDYLARYPDQPFAAQAAVLQSQAQPAAAVLQQPGVQLFRAAFLAAGRNDVGLLRRAALGDREAALSLAQQALRTEGEQRRGAGWLQYASQLGSGPAAYALALHYRREGQPLLAAQHEARALDLGFAPPPALDHLRK